MKRAIAVLVCVALLGSTFAAFAGAESVTLDTGNFAISLDEEGREIGDGVWQISDFGIDYCYLIVGEESCLLIDTGVGFENFRERVEKYTDGKPVTVALTHGHVDHAGGAGQFETVYINDADREVLWQQRVVVRRLFSMFYTMLIGIVTRSILPGINDKNNLDTTEYLSMEDGHSFDLGGRTVTFTLTPGHTGGSGCFSDSKTGYLFTGDMTSTNVLLFFIESQTVDIYRQSLDTILRLQREATATYCGHSLKPVAVEITEALMVAADELLNGSNIKLPVPFIKTADTADGKQSVKLTGWRHRIHG